MCVLIKLLNVHCVDIGASYKRYVIHVEHTLVLANAMESVLSFLLNCLCFCKDMIVTHYSAVQRNTN